MCEISHFKSFPHEKHQERNKKIEFVEATLQKSMSLQEM